MLEILNSLTWPAAFAIVASLVSIITGFLALLSKAFSSNHKTSTETREEKIDMYISEIRDRVAAIEGDMKEVKSSMRNTQKQVADHEKRDIEDFKLVEAKLDRLMDIVVRILQED